ncbi:MAG: type IX secretion system membrane protein PorP/SprF [Cytophagales bacterium]
MNSIFDISRKTPQISTIFLMLLSLLSQSLKSQDAQFSQFYVSSLYLNPALAGQEGEQTFSSNYRMQWRSVANPFVTNQLSFIHPLKTKEMFHNHKGGVGVSLFNDRAGEGSLKTNGFHMSGAYNLELAKSSYHFLSFGLQMGLIQKTIDFANLQWGSQYNPYIGFDANQVPDETNVVNGRLYADINAGLMWYYNGTRDYEEAKFSGYAGFSGYHLNQPNESFIRGNTSRLPMLLRAHAGFEYEIGERFYVSPNALYAMQSQSSQLNLGLYFTVKMNNSKEGLYRNARFTFGGWHRLKDSYVFSTGFGSDIFQFGFSYDLNTSSLRYATGGRGAYELSLVLRRVKTEKLKRYSTPRF